jgi:hypothetical protein
MRIVLALSIGGLAAWFAARPADSDWPLREAEHVQRTLAFSGTGDKEIEIDNVWGSIEVAAHDAPGVAMSATRTVRARTEPAREAAASEVTLDVREEGPIVRLYVDGPFRDCGTRRGRRSCHDPGYVVQYDFAVSVPRDVRVCLRTVNDGDIRVSGVTGAYSVHNVNGGIEMLDVAGAGEVDTVNEDISVVFAQNPPGRSSFSSVNGDLTVLFRKSLAADLRLKSFNGELYTDFDTGPLSARPPNVERRGAAFVYKTDRSVGLRVGAGGPEISFETLNGDIHILDRGTR